MKLRSPTGHALEPDTPHSLAGGGERWPVVDGITFLRAGREALAAEALVALDRGDPRAAAVLLLADQDDWWTGPATDPDELGALVDGRDRLSLREAMALLRLGPVADYFAYRWSDPTYLAGLALLEAHWSAPASAFELACGIGHYLRELTRRGVACVGADVVFAKCWLAKHWVAPGAEYVVFDAAHPWPVEARFDLAICQDAFYFLPEQAAVAKRLRALGAVVAVGHLHDVGWREGALGPARPAAEWAALFPDATVYDERELLRALLDGDAPRASGFQATDAVEAWSLVEGGGAARAVSGGLALPPTGAVLRGNPLIENGAPAWPSERWRREYGWGCAWATDGGDPVRTRRVLDLPERW